MNNAETYLQQRGFSDKFERHIKALLGGVFFANDFNKDISEATDLLILTIKSNLTFACRIRRHNFIKYSDQFTLRYSVKSGTKTELEKIKDGFADYMFYGFCDEMEKYIVRYYIVDLNVFRLHIKNNPEYLSKIISNRIPNKNPANEFVYFPIKDFPDSLIKKSWAGRYNEQYLIF